ncbi:MAG: hypothetical protein IJ571_03135 [Ruminococcus sp.]|nr:hypothetical protein [Ruminococcus sp.]
MILKAIAAVLAAVMLCMTFTSCGDNESSSAAESSKGDTGTSSATETSSKADTADSSEGAVSSEEATTVSVAETDYDVNGDFRAYDVIKDKYSDGYSLDLRFQNAALGTHGDIKVVWQGEKAYYSSVIDGMKSYVLIPGDGKAYRVSEGTTTYQMTDEAPNQAMMNDILINPVGEFDHAAIGEGNVVFEYYNIDEKMGGEGQIVFGFNGETYDLVEIVVVTNGDEMTASYYYVDELAEADEELLKVPDLSAYTLES